MAELVDVTKLVRPIDAAEIIGVSRQCVTQAMDDGRLPVVKVGRARMLNRSDVNKHKGAGEIKCLPARGTR